MANYAIGDLQGCFKPFQALLSEVDFNPSRDHLYLVGDIVARGPDSLACLDYIFRHQDAMTVTLGNHDLHLMACYLLERDPNPKDKLQAVFHSPLIERYIRYLQTQPLAAYLADQKTFISHAGIHPSWSIPEALKYAEFAQNCYNSEEAELFLEKMYAPHPNHQPHKLTPVDQFRAIVNVFTRMRFLDENNNLNFSEKGAPGANTLSPWFTDPRFAQDNNRYIFGHWAALQGKTHKSNVIGLDTGCVWGGNMTLLNLQTGEYFLSN